MMSDAEQAPVVSIGVPVHNGEKYLCEAFDSLLGQSFKDFEIVVSDNGSSDATMEICRDYASRDPRIRYHRQDTNIGSVGNFNFVFEVSKGKYFKWAAHDDICQPEFLATCVKMLESDPQLIWCHTRSDMIDADGNTWLDQLPEDAPELVCQADGSIWWEGPPRADANSDDAFRRFAGVLLGTNWCVDSYGLIRASALRKTRLLLPVYGAEKILMGELSLLGKYGHSPELLFAQRIHADASSSLNTAAAQDAFAANSRNRPPLATRILLLKAHLTAVHRAPLSSMAKIRCWFVVARYLFQIRKWRTVLGTLQGKGVGGGGRRMLDARKNAEKAMDRSKPVST